MAEPWATYSIVNLASERTIIHKTGNNKNPALNENKFKFLLPVSRPTPSWEYILNITCFEYITAWSTLATLNLIDQFVTLTVSMPLPLLLLEMKRNCLFLCYFLWINSLFNFHSYPHFCFHSNLWSCCSVLQGRQFTGPHRQSTQTEYQLPCREIRFTWWKSNSLNIHFLQDIGNNVLYRVVGYSVK